MDPSTLFTPTQLDRATQAYEDVVIYDGTDEDDALYEGPILIHPNGWLELEGDRLLSPSAVHHIDIYDDIDIDEATDEQGDDRQRETTGWDDWGRDDSGSDRDAW
ncbi:hypothetical protein [Halopiger xanaduensis]|uniref:Uncharacterized protein n=1 Tax=Halopiger xanaduensis (strain DSM 18323 / JCM 14033 / SH-6) TaxID=797210 RepID=F8D8A0_HALXS|nr:hypothetical protein [Halopiger xanaduensis]AEH36745.1 hypothetical protein Halxa_2120 [Halopiger xanaduensis SH-6]